MSIDKTVPRIHSIGEFVLAVPKLEQGDHFYKSFGLDVREEGNHLALRAPGTGNYRWGRLLEGKNKFLHHVTFHCFGEDLQRFKTHLEAQRLRLLDPPAGFDSDGLWFYGHDGILMEIRIGPKTSPDELSKIVPPPLQPGVANAPYRCLADKVHISRLSHILLFTTDVNKAIDFYTR